MAYYLSKYIGTYRLKADIDLSTNDFPREIESDRLEQNDVYIACQKGGKIYHYGKNILVCYVPSLGRGRNILKKIGESQGVILEDYYTGYNKQNIFNYDSFYKDLTKYEIVSDIEETDEEVLWKFKDKDIKFMTSFMLPLTIGASISPYSTKNLPIKKYEIPKENLAEYKEITNQKNIDILIIAHLTKSFINDYIPSNYHKYKKVNMSKLMKRECLKGKEFIHSLGMWDEYIQYLKIKTKEDMKE